MPTISMPPMERRVTEIIHAYRRYSRDYAELNRLIRGEESSDRDVRWAIADYIDHFNEVGHLSSYTLANYPMQGRSLLIRGVTVTLLEGVVMLGIRNYSSFSDGGLNFSTESRIPLLQGFAAQLREQVDARIRSLKASLNIEEALGGAGAFSEYARVNGAEGWVL